MFRQAMLAKPVLNQPARNAEKHRKNRNTKHHTRKTKQSAKQQNGKQLILELKADDSIFLLGYRAKGFIKRNFIDESE